MTADLVVLTDSNLPDTGTVEEILTAAGLRTARAQATTEDEVVAAADGAVAVMVQWAPITADVLDRLEACRFVSRLGIGYDMIDVPAATARGIAVANTPDYCVEEVATHTLALILAATRGVVALDRAVRAGRWAAVSDAPHAVRPSATTVAIVGYGRIGSRTAAFAGALGFRVLVHDPYVDDAVIAAAGHVAAGLHDALGAADVVSLHVPLTPETRHLLDDAALKAMRPGAIVVNTCRGGLVDEEALVASIRGGHLAGAALDVFQTEPLPSDSPLLTAAGVTLTPHSAWYSPASLAELPRHAAQQVVDFLAGRAVPSIVNPAYAKVDPAGRRALRPAGGRSGRRGPEPRTAARTALGGRPLP